MTPLQHEPSAQAPWIRTIFGRVFMSGFLSWLRLMAIVRREAAAGVSAALLHFADALLRGWRGGTAGLAGREGAATQIPPAGDACRGSPRQASSCRPC